MWLSLPKMAASTVAPAALIVLCAPGYEGSAAVGASASHVGLARVAGFPSVSASRMAVIGLQDKGADVAPPGEDWRGEVGCCRTVVARQDARHEGCRHDGRTIIGAGGQHFCGDGVPGLDPVLLGSSVRNQS